MDSPPLNLASGTTMIPVVKLSCEQCQRRKTKCDKSMPCSACSRAGIRCTQVQRHRLPRGRSGNNKKTRTEEVLKNRLDRLENIVSSLQYNAEKSHDSASLAPTVISDSGSGQTRFVADTPVPLASFIAAEFWDELSETIAGMRKVLEEPYADNNMEGTEGEADPMRSDLSHLGGDSTSFSSNEVGNTFDPHVILFGPYAAFGAPQPSSKTKQWLFDIYQARVDPIFKVLHWPSTRSLLLCNSSYVGEQATLRTAVECALESAICFAAMCALFDSEVDRRQATMEEYRKNAEWAFSRAGLLTTGSLTLLQAFLIYLGGIRACQANALQWTLVAIAKRIASAQGISDHPKVELSPLKAEIRSRVWFSIGLLDMQSSFDRGSQPLLKSDEFKSWPININDNDLSAQSSLPPIASPKFTDMSFSLLVYQAGIFQRKLTEIGSLAASGAINPIAASEEQTAILDKLEQDVRQISVLCDSPPTAIQRFTVAVGEESLLAMRLLLRRPLHRRGQSCSSTIEKRADDFDILAVATGVLERSQCKRSDGDFAQWAWFSWVKWYALAVVLAELCTTNSELGDHAWNVAQRSYTDYARIVADSNSGLLWRPIMKLMSKVKQVRALQVHTKQIAGGATQNDSGIGEHPLRALDGQLESYLATKTSDSQAVREPQQANMDLAGQDISWLHWDVLIDDINSSSVDDDIAWLEFDFESYNAQDFSSDQA